MRVTTFLPACCFKTQNIINWDRRGEEYKSTFTCVYKVDSTIKNKMLLRNYNKQWPLKIIRFVIVNNELNP